MVLENTTETKPKSNSLEVQLFNSLIDDISLALYELDATFARRFKTTLWSPLPKYASPPDISYSRNQLFTMFSMCLRIIIKVMIQKPFNRREGHQHLIRLPLY